MYFPVPTPILVGSNLLLILIIFLLLQPVCFKREAIPRLQNIAGIICIFLFCLFSFWGTDWFHYQEIFLQIKEYSKTSTNIEFIYIYLIKNICPNYIVFRLIIWGTGLLLIHLTISRLKINAPLTWFFFGTIFIPLYAYARVSLAIAIMIYGAILLCRPFEHHRIISYTLGFFLICISYFFHKSALIGISVLLFSFIIKDPKKYSWILYSIGFISCIIISKILISVFMETSIQEDAAYAKYGQAYLYSKYGTTPSGIGALIAISLERSVFYLVAFISYKILHNYYIPHGIHFLMKFQIFLVFFASLFYFETGANTGLLVERIIRFAIIPSAIILSYAHQYNLYSKLVLSTFAIGMAQTVYSITYSLYNSTFL